MTTNFFIFGLARLTRICNPSTDSETSLKVMRYWKFSQKSKLKQKFLLIVKKKWEIFFKTGTIVKGNVNTTKQTTNRPTKQQIISFLGNVGINDF